MSADPRPIGVFDSGIGGLTVLRVLLDKFPNENFIYLGDTARLPYGSKSPETIRKYSEQTSQFLISRGVKAIVIACNSASTQMTEAEFHGIPVYNVIRPGAEKALQSASNGRIGVIGTRATISSGAYERELKTLDPKIQVFSIACPLLVPFAEEGWDADPVTNLIVYRYLQGLMSEQIDTLIMGCTHYPLLEGSIVRVTGSSVTLVDSGHAIAARMAADIKAGTLVPNQAQGTLQLLLTDGSGLFVELSKKILGRVTSVEIANL